MTTQESFTTRLGAVTLATLARDDVHKLWGAVNGIAEGRRRASAKDTSRERRTRTRYRQAYSRQSQAADNFLLVSATGSSGQSSLRTMPHPWS